jgi:hypothetical protein
MSNNLAKQNKQKVTQVGFTQMVGCAFALQKIVT